MQDGAPPHVLSSVNYLLNQPFGNRVISRHFPFPLPPRSSDLAPTDLWFWGYVKSKVYNFHCELSDLKDAIKTVIQEIPVPIVHAAVLSSICRMQNVIVCEGGCVENL